MRDKSLARARDAIRAATPRNSGDSLTDIIRHVNRWARGWFGSFRSIQRSILSRRHGRERWGRGLAHQLWPNAYFGRHDLFSLEQAHVGYLHPHNGNR